MSHRTGHQNNQGRSWIAIRFGSEHPHIHRRNVEYYISRLYEYLNQRGVNLRPWHTGDIVNTVNYIEARQAIENLRDESSSIENLPLLLFIDDHKPPARDHIVEDFVNEMYVFETRGDELQEMLDSNNFNDAEDWCDEFVQHYVPIKPADIPSTSLREPQSENNSRNNYSDRNLISNGVSGNGNYNQGSSVGSSEYNYRNNQNFENDRRFNDRSPSEEYQHYEYNKCAYSNHPRYKEDHPEQKNTRNTSYDVEEPDLVNFNSVRIALEEFNELSFDEQDDFIGNIAGNCLFNRLSTPFSNFNENEMLLELLGKSLESALTKPNLEHAKILLVEMVERGFLHKMITQTRKFSFDNPLYALKSLMNIFLKALKISKPEEQRRFQDAWNLFFDLLSDVPSNIWDRNPEAHKWFTENVKKIQRGNDKKEKPEPIIQENNEIYYDAPSNFFVQPYVESETKEPPEDFRNIAALPTKRDIRSPEIIYLRRSVVDGPYKDAQHYLDVQFRLFREDLVSPLRDGLGSHKRNGTSRYDRIPAVEINGAQISDIVLFDVQQVMGIQVRFNHGDNMRYIQLETSNFLEAVANRHLKYGQLIALSCDRFESDVHVGIIVERNDNELVSNGLLGVHFISDGGLDMKKGYILAEPASYLEMYSHVLKVMQSIDQFSPLPMERYLVQAKTSRRHPRYLRYLQNEEDEEDEKLEKMYIEKFFSKRGQKTQNSENEHEVQFDPQKVVVGRKRITLAEPRIRECMKIRGKIYKVDNLEEELDLDDYDPSQRKALISALTSELALIQGPPGTGKTFIGVEIVRTILENRNRYGINEPILLVCYTNAALDQFLEKILEKITSDVETKRYAHDGPIAVRLGLKSDSGKLERAGIMKKDIVAHYKSDYAMDEEREVGIRSKQKRLATASLATASYIVSQEAQSEIIAFEALKAVISSTVVNEMYMWGCRKKDSRQEKLANDEILACWLLDKSLEGGAADMFPPIDNDDDNELEKSNARKTPFDEEEDNIPLDVLFKQMNKIAEEHQARLRELWNNRDDFDKQYETEVKWDIVKKDPNIIKNVVIFNGGGCKRVSDNRRLIEIPHDQTIVNELNDVKDNIIKATPLSEEEVIGIRSIYDLPKQRRWQLYSYWITKLRAKVKAEIPVFMKNYQVSCDNTHKALKRQDAAVLSKSLIIGATTTGAAKFRDLLDLVGCRIIIIEEAAEVLEAHTFASLLPAIEQVILIGDHQQLRPNPSVYELARTYNMDVSLFERLIKNGAPFNTLEKQHRMHPDITKTIVRPHFYNMLKDADEVKEYREVLGMKHRLFMWAHSSPENTGLNDVSYSNQTEIEMIMSLLQYLIKQGYGYSEVTVIATYSAQVEALKQKVLTKFGTTSGNTGPAIAVETVDSFQGKENKIVVVSLVRSCGSTIGFLQTANRICVALTRAKHGMYIVGNAQHLSTLSTLWDKICTSLQEADNVGDSLPIKCFRHGKIQLIQNPSEFAVKSPDGGCDALCGYDLDCGHKCGRRCHPIDDHSTYQCQFPCKRTCNNKAFSHECPRNCFEDCGLCQQIETVTLKCGHATNVPCHAAEKAQCVEQCEEILPCNHRCRALCSRPCKTYCEEDIAIDFPCGHILITPCHNRNRELKCANKCDEMLPCGHECQELCGEICTTKCMADVERTLSCGHQNVMACSSNPLTEICSYPVFRLLTCGHECDVPCYAGDDRKYCNSPCCQELPCGHVCEGKCGECFVNGKHICAENCKKYLKCGHHCTKRCGEICGDCMALECNNGCSHVTCGSSRKSLNKATEIFNRSCSQQCILCTKRCNNFCTHRSCQRRCYEACDIKPCEMPCTLQLKCSHACLGMCGEDCPDLCGTCGAGKAYKNLLSRYNLPNEFHRLISISLCGHIIPVKILDDYVARLQEEKTMPRCPICEGSLNGVKRYAKNVKKVALEIYDNKEKSYDEACVSHTVMMGGKLTIKALQAFQLKIGRKEYKACRNIIDTHSLSNLINMITRDADTVIGKGTKNLAVVKDLSLFLQCLCEMYGVVWDCFKDYGKVITGPANFQECIESINRRQIFHETRQSLRYCCQELEMRYTTYLRGAIVPFTRFQFFKVLFNLTIWKFAELFSKSNGKSSITSTNNQRDLTSNQVREIKNIAISFKQCTVGDDYAKHYARFLQYLNEKVLNIESQIKFDFNIPEF